MKKLFTLGLCCALALLAVGATIQWYSDQPSTTSLLDTDTIAVERAAPQGYKSVTLLVVKSYIGTNGPLTVNYLITTNLYVEYVTNTYFYTTNLYARNLHSTYNFFTNATVEYLSVSYVTNEYAYITNLYSSYTTNLYLYTTNFYSEYSYLTNLYVDYITNNYAYITNLFVDYITNNYLYTTNVTASYVTNEYLYTTNVTANYITNNYLYTTNITAVTVLANTNGVGNLYVTNNTFYVTNLWAGPTNSINLGLRRVRFVLADALDCAITNMVGGKDGFNSSVVLELRNASGGNQTCYLTCDTTGTGDGARSYVLTNGVTTIFSIDCTPGIETNFVVRPLW